MKKLPIGIQVYSLRDQAGEDFKGTVQAIKDAGYDFVELAGTYGHTAQDIRNMLDEVGIPALSAHVPFEELSAEKMEQTISDYITMGCKFIAIPYLMDDKRYPNEAFSDVMVQIRAIGECCKEKGVTLLYHNHEFEFEKMEDGRYVLDYMYETIPADLLQAEIDICWVNIVNERVDRYIKKYKGRCPIVHLKDYVKYGNPEQTYKPETYQEEVEEIGDDYFEFRPVGFGCQMVQDAIRAAVESDAQYLVVEQDRSVGRTPMEAMKMSRTYLKMLGQ